MTVTEALQRRTSIRKFLPDPLEEGLVRDILEVARWAPSGGNLQAWRVVAVAGEERDAVVRLAAQSGATYSSETPDDRPVYPPSLWEPYRTRRYQLGEDMYALLGIPRSDRQGRLAQWARNYEFFGAPVGLFFVIEERMGHAQWAHLGMLIQSIALAAIERGVSSCMQESWSSLRGPLKAHFQLAPDEMIYCGMALGVADPAAKVNTLRSQRAAVDDFTVFRGFKSRGDSRGSK
ncbi:MAG TPA: nitroreductase [Steroidobacteraceae bacterium]|nr:nitroreductase [Steroidobacteraceae bacterium]